jgi:cephalosporin hydroxylase
MGTPPATASDPSWRLFTSEALDGYFKLENQPGKQAKISTQHLKLYHLVRAMDRPVVVECGVDVGISNLVLRAACEETDGHLNSIDIRDCSHVVSSPAGTFIQSDDRDVEAILRRAPAIAQGIDLIHIDSLHTEDHVKALLNAWFKYVKQGGYLTFHDIDNMLYRPGQWRASRPMAQNNAGVAKAVKEFFHANEDELFLEFHFGVTGMGIMKKLMPMDKTPNPAVPVEDWPTSPSAAPRVRESARALASAIGRSLAYRFRGR